MKSEEAMHITVSVVTISLAFAILFSGTTEFSSEFATVFVKVFFTVGLGFILHELAHKYVAQSYGAFAEYKSWTTGLILAIVMAVFLGFVFAAPGAVYIYGPHLSREKNGKIALAGPVTNLVLALGFIALGFLLPELQGLARMGASVNAFLGVFNMIPFHPLDGQKVFAWSPKAWAAAMLLLIVVLFNAYGVV